MENLPWAGLANQGGIFLVATAVRMGQVEVVRLLLAAVVERAGSVETAKLNDLRCVLEGAMMGLQKDEAGGSPTRPAAMIGMLREALAAAQRLADD